MGFWYIRVTRPRLFADLDPTPKRIQWRLSSKLSFRLQQAEASLSDLINQTEIEAIEFLSFGKRAIKEVKMSPDAFVQMAFQLAYYRFVAGVVKECVICGRLICLSYAFFTRLYGEFVGSYETVMTKRFKGGRTEPVRPLVCLTPGMLEPYV